jgi:diamine N-acetyltransferase
VAGERGRGTGRSALRLLKRLAFEELGAQRLWLDVVAAKESARRLYISEGFVEEGILREAARRASGFASLVVMCILEHEHGSG